MPTIVGSRDQAIAQLNMSNASQECVFIALDSDSPVTEVSTRDADPMVSGHLPALRAQANVITSALQTGNEADVTESCKINQLCS